MVFLIFYRHHHRPYLDRSVTQFRAALGHIPGQDNTGFHVNTHPPFNFCLLSIHELPQDVHTDKLTQHPDYGFARLRLLRLAVDGAMGHTLKRRVYGIRINVNS